jgi:Flp pilus assembly protein protease CpaA
MIAIAIILYGAQSILTGSFWPIVNSLIAGFSLLGFGFLMYYLGQWGGGDAKILASIGFLLPQLPEGFALLVFPFPLSYLINVFLVGLVYMLIYAFVFALINRKIIIGFFKDIKANSSILLIGSACLIGLFFGVNLYLSQSFNVALTSLLLNSLLPLGLVIFLFLIWRFAKVVEEFGFKRKIPVSKLKVGDILEESRKLEGITEKELRKIKKSKKKFVRIKEGVRFAPSFALALVFTLLFGDGILLLVGTLA